MINGDCIFSEYKSKSPENLTINSPAGEFKFRAGAGDSLTPTSFLDSPVFLSNIKGEPSPTNGSIFKPHMMHGCYGGSTTPSFITSSSYTSASSNSRGFVFKPDFGGFSPLGSLIPLTDQKQQEARQVIEVQPEQQPQSSGPSIAVKSEMGSIDDSNSETDVLDLEQKRLGSQVVTSQAMDDGYNWRKYGQKLVKGGNSLDSFGQTPKDCEPSSTLEQPTCEANDNNGEAGISQLNGFTDDDDDPFAKRRRMEISEVDMNSVVKPIREPRVVVQTVSEIDILDDGYRWRKYGQKVVRGNPNPRSYY